MTRKPYDYYWQQQQYPDPFGSLLQQQSQFQALLSASPVFKTLKQRQTKPKPWSRWSNDTWVFIVCCCVYTIHLLGVL